MFTTGVVFLPFFTFMTALIAIPTGVKMFNWLATLWRGSIVFTSAMLFGLGIQDTYFVVAHLHYVFFGGAAMGVFAAAYYWFPKMSGRLLNETLGKIHFAMLFIGFNATFFVQHMLGIQGMPRRVADYAADAGWTEMNLISTVGAFLIAFSMVPFVINVVTSLVNGRKAGDDPWEGNTLEWATTSPPPTYNFDSLPPIRSERPVFDHRHRGEEAHP
jgi:cytochrome c oxidase subunit 1